jgi:DNA topoisomerase-1
VLIEKIKDQLKKIKSKKELKMELKNISLGTSKANYIDPRITVAFLKMHNLPVEKVFSKALREKFNWAFQVDKDFKF